MTIPIDAPPDAADDLVVVVLGCESMRLDVERAFALAAALRIADDFANREPPDSLTTVRGEPYRGAVAL